MRSIGNLACLVLLACLVGGCGLILNGTRTRLPIDSDPQGAEIWLDGRPVGRTPAVIEVESGHDHTLVFKRPGEPDRAVPIERRLSGQYLVLDMLLTAFVGVLIDAATGAWYEAVPETLDVVLAPAPGAGS